MTARPCCPPGFVSGTTDAILSSVPAICSAATFASATGPCICAGAPAGPTMICAPATTDGDAAKATSPDGSCDCSIRPGPETAIIASPPPAAATFCGSVPGSARSMAGSSLPANSYSPYASVRMMLSITAAR